MSIRIEGQDPRQSGTALPVALIFMVIMTLIGVAGLQSSNMQERMAGNLRDRNLAFQAAEAALRGGEAWVTVLGNQPVADANALLDEPAAWDGATATGNVPGLDAQLASDPDFHVGPPSLRRIGIQLPPDFRRVYPVTGRGEGGTDTAVVILQSTFEPPQ